jgi:hypothetical protein
VDHLSRLIAKFLLSTIGTVRLLWMAFQSGFGQNFKPLSTITAACCHNEYFFKD